MADKIKNAIRIIPDFPKPGIQFKDITPVLSNPEAFQQAIDIFVARYKDEGITQVACIESRGFIFGAPVALALGAGMTLIRKKGKLPAETVQETYALEYGVDTLELHADALTAKDKVLVIDDLLATGGTAVAAGNLIDKLGAEVHAFAFLVELSFLEGRRKLQDNHREVFSILSY
jgi:adenine phosphoribosyltransferase